MTHPDLEIGKGMRLKKLCGRAAVFYLISARIMKHVPVFAPRRPTVKRRQVRSSILDLGWTSSHKPLIPLFINRLKRAINDFSRLGYRGPCPPHRHGPHHYHFRLLALSLDHLPLLKGPSCREVESEARKYLLAEAGIVGIYER